MHASESNQAKIFVQHLPGEDLRGSGLHLVPLAKEVAHPVVDVVVDHPICLQPRPVAEIPRPSDQKLIQTAQDISPWVLVAHIKQSVHLAFEPLRALT